MSVEITTAVDAKIFVGGEEIPLEGLHATWTLPDRPYRVVAYTMPPSTPVGTRKHGATGRTLTLRILRGGREGRRAERRLRAGEFVENP